MIKGPNVARGYLNEEQTKSVFIEDLTWAESSPDSTSKRRFYCTGDLGSYNKDRSINFVGRNNRQIKIRGQRLEIGEVEYHFREYLPSSIKVAVFVIIPSNGDKILATFLVLQDIPGKLRGVIIVQSPLLLPSF